MKLWKSLLAAVLSVLLIASMSVCAFAYTDVGAESSYYEYINVVDSLGLITANKMDDFSPKNYYTRGDALITAYRMIYGSDEGLEEYANNMYLFDDVDDMHPVLPYVNWAYDNGLITNELAERNFQPAEPISAPEFLTLFVKVGNIDPTASSGGNMGGDEMGGGEMGDDMMPFALAEETPEEETPEEDEGLADGEGTVDSGLVYPDSYIDAAYSFAGDIMGDEAKITRELAAMAIAQLLWFQDDSTNIDLTTLEDGYGNRLDCFATNVYGLNKVNLTIRATKDRTLGYEVSGDVLLSNGSILETDEDLSAYVGHSITVTYCDTDRSGTLTEDEKIVDYVLNSMMFLDPPLSDITFSSYTDFMVSALGMTFYITNASKLYYNDELWNQDPLNNLITIAGGVGGTIKTRPNMSFTVIPSDIFDPVTNNNLVMEVFVEEHHPAKIIDVSDGVYTLYDYYARGTKNECVSFSTSDIVFETSATSVGDYVNFYTTGGKCYLLDGSAKKVKLSKVEGNDLLLEDGTRFTPHQLYKRSSNLPALNTELIVVTEDKDGSYYLSWEYANAKEKTPALILSFVENLETVTYHIYDCTTDTETDIEVPTDNIMSASRIEEGEFIYYSMDTEGAYSVVRANVSEKVHLGVETDTYFVESGTGTEYKKSAYYYGNMYTDTFKADYYKMILDVAGNVLALI